MSCRLSAELSALTVIRLPEPNFTEEPNVKGESDGKDEPDVTIESDVKDEVDGKDEPNVELEPDVKDEL